MVLAHCRRFGASKNSFPVIANGSRALASKILKCTEMHGNVEESTLPANANNVENNNHVLKVARVYITHLDG